MRATFIAALFLVVSACSGPTTTEKSASDINNVKAGASDTKSKEPGQIAREFWVHISKNEYASAVELASFPFDLDSHNKCMQGAVELADKLDKDRPANDPKMVIGDVIEVTAQMDMSELHNHWHRHIQQFTDSKAPCLGEKNKEGIAVKYVHFLVNFSFNGNQAGSLTRIRCLENKCTVAGIDN